MDCVERPACVLLVSRQALRPCRGDAWVRAVGEALRWVGECGGRVLTSVGTTTWGLQVAAARQLGVPQTVVVCPDGEETDAGVACRVRRGFGLGQDTMVWCVGHTREGRARRARMALRDRVVMQAADVLVPVSVRPGATMDAVLEKARADGRHVEERFRVDYTLRRERLVDRPDLSGAVLPPGHWIVHWTRTSNGPWPDERPVDFYDDLLRRDCYPRSAFDTLTRILSSRRIIASPRHMPGNIPCVSFTAASVQGFVPLMRWRSRYREMSFEPYGVGIRVSAARNIGVRPVHYHDRRDSPDAGPVWGSQSAGVLTDWRQEQEWRVRGDVDLADISPGDLAAICPTEAERERALAAAGFTDARWTATV